MAGGRASGLSCILVGLPPSYDFQETAALASAIALAQAQGAVLSLFVFAPEIGALPHGGHETTAAIFERAAERLEAMCSHTIKSAVRSISQAGIEVTAERAHSAREPGDARFVQLARVNDLTVLDAAGLGETAARAAIEDALFDSGRPVLVAPAASRGRVPKRIAIAWDGSARAARAVKDSLPLLASAETVIAASVTGEKDLSRMAPGADLATYLFRHGVDCRIETLAAIRGDVAKCLREFAEGAGIDMIVSGAFVHSRLREAVLGGVTRSLLDDCGLPLLMAH